MYQPFYHLPYYLTLTDEVLLLLVLQYYSYSEKPGKVAEKNGPHFEVSDIGLRFVLIT